jgi:hypothetical protein
MAKYLPQGTTFAINGKYVGGLIGVSLPQRSRGSAETTDSDSGSDREYIPGLRDGGTVQLTFRHDPDDSGQQELNANYAAVGSAAVVSCSIALPDASTTAASGQTFTFDAFVTEPPRGDLALVDDKAAELQATLKVSGVVSVA